MMSRFSKQALAYLQGWEIGGRCGGPTAWWDREYSEPCFHTLPPISASRVLGDQLGLGALQSGRSHVDGG